MAKANKTAQPKAAKTEKLTLADVFPGCKVEDLKLRSHVSGGICHVQCAQTGVGGSFRVAGNEALVRQLDKQNKLTAAWDKDRRSNASDVGDGKETA